MVDNETVYEAFQYAIIKRDHQYLLSIIQKDKYDVNVQNAQGWTPLHKACLIGNCDAARLLLNHGADPNLKDIFKQTPGFLATLNRRHGALETLIAHAPDLDLFSTNSAGVTPLLECCRNDDVQGVGMILKSIDADKTACIPHLYGCQCTVIMQKNANILELFITLGFTISHLDDKQVYVSPLGMAISTGYILAVARLLRAGARTQPVSDFASMIVKNTGVRYMRLFLQHVASDLHRLTPFVTCRDSYALSDYTEILQSLMEVGYKFTKVDMSYIEENTNREIVMYIKKVNGDPPSLLHLSRLKVRAMLGSRPNNVSFGLSKLDVYIPMKIRLFLMLSDLNYDVEWMYQE